MTQIPTHPPGVETSDAPRPTAIPVEWVPADEWVDPPKSQVDYDPDQLLAYAGEWIVWSPDGRSVLVHTSDPDRFDELLAPTGFGLHQCVVEYIDHY